MFGAIIPFYQVSVGRWKRVRRMSAIAGLIAAAVFLLTVSRTAYPGFSAQSIATCAGLGTPSSFARPVFRALCGLWDKIPLPFDTAVRFNILAALLGGCLVAMLFQIVWCLVTEFMCEESARAVAPRAARLAAWTASLCAMLTLPVWMGATRFTPEIADAAGILFAFYLLLHYAYRDDWRALALFAVFYGCGMCESYLFLLASPLLFFCWARVEWTNADSGFRPRFWLNVAAGAVALGFDFLLATWQTAAFRAEPFAGAMAVPTMVTLLRNQMDQFLASLPAKSWILVAFTGYALLLVVFFTARRTLQNSRSSSALILLVLASVLGVYGLFNLGGTAWATLAPEGHIPVLGAVATAFTVGLIVACWRALGSMNAPAELKDGSVDTEEAEPQVSRLVTAGKSMGSLFCPLVLAGVIAACCFNVTQFRLHDGDFGDYVADSILDDLGGRHWIIANDLFDANLLLRARERKQDILLFQPYRTGDLNYRFAIRHTLEKQVPENVWLRASKLLDVNFLLFLEELVINMPGFDSRTVSLSMPDLWYNGNYRPHVGAFFFSGTKMSEQGQPADSVIQLKRWDRYAELVGFGSRRSGCPLSERHRTAMTHLLSLEVNNFGTELDDAGRPEEAFKLYELARKYNPDNVSALLNLIDLVVNRKMHSGRRADLTKKLAEILKDKTMRYPLWALSRYHGYIRNYKVFEAQGLAWVCSSSPASVLDTLRHAQIRQTGLVQEDAGLLAALASVYAVHGDYEKSLENYQKILTKDPKDVRAVSGAAQLMIR